MADRAPGRHRGPRRPGGPVRSGPAATRPDGRPGRYAGLDGAVWSFVVRHRLLLLLLVPAVVLRGMAAVAYRPALVFYGDSYDYLLSAHTLAPNPTHPFGYPALIRLADVAGIGLPGLVLVQHVLGLVTGVVTYALLRRFRLPPWAAALGAVPVLFDGYVLSLEQFVLSEALFDFLLVSMLAVLVWPRRPGMKRCALVGLLLAWASLTRFSGDLLVVPLLAYAGWRRIGWRSVVALLTAFVVPLLGYATWFDAVNGHFGLSVGSGLQLYGRVAPFAECRGLHLPADERRLCQSTPPSSRPGPEFYKWTAASPGGLGKVADPVLKDFAERVILHQPLTYLHVVGTDVLDTFVPGRPTFHDRPSVATWRFQVHYPDLAHAGPALALYGARPLARSGVARLLRAYQSVAYTQGPLLALALATGLLGTLLGRDRPRRRAEAMLWTFAALVLLLPGPALVQFSWRYLLPVDVVLPVGGLLGAAALWQHGRGDPPGAAPGSRHHASATASAR